MISKLLENFMFALLFSASYLLFFGVLQTNSNGKTKMCSVCRRFPVSSSSLFPRCVKSVVIPCHSLSFRLCRMRMYVCAPASGFVWLIVILPLWFYEYCYCILVAVSLSLTRSLSLCVFHVRIHCFFSIVHIIIMRSNGKCGNKIVCRRHRCCQTQKADCVIISISLSLISSLAQKNDSGVPYFGCFSNTFT